MIDENRQAEALRRRLDQELAGVHITAEARERLDSRLAPQLASHHSRWDLRRLPTAMALPLAEPGHLGAMLPWIMLLGLIIFVPPNFLVLWAAQRIDSARVGILLMTEVLFGALSAGLLSGQPFTMAEGIGTALIISAGLIEVLRR